MNTTTGVGAEIGQLLIQLVNNRWMAMVANGGPAYEIAGATLADQEASIEMLANAMHVSENLGQLVTLIQNDVFVDADNVGVDVITQELFQTTSSMYYAGQVVVELEEDELLADALEAAGTALLALL